MKITNLAIIITVFCGASVEAADFEASGLYYNITSSTEPLTVEVTSQNNELQNYDGLTEVKIPSKVTYKKKEYAITAIGYGAFMYCDGLESVQIPDCVTRIGENAFAGCSGLTSVKIPDKVARISDYAFTGCTNLKTINIPDGTTSIGIGAFDDCESLASINIPEGVLSIGEHAFESCYALKSVQIPQSVTSIATATFMRCFGLESITIPATVTSIGDDAFYECGMLKSISLPKGVDYIGEYAFALCCELGSVNIPAGVVSIGKGTFYGCEKLKSVEIPDAVLSIGEEAFASCESLASVTIPDNVTEIGGSAFKGTRLTSVQLPKNIRHISEELFSDCMYLTSVDIPDGVTVIGVHAFNNCRSLQSVKIPESVTYIGNYAFSSSGMTSIVIPSGVTSIERCTFYGCAELTHISIPEGVTTIEDEAFASCEKLSNIVIPSSVRTIGWCAFNDCENLKTVTCLPQCPPELDDYVFGSNTALTVLVPCSAGSSVKKAYQVAWGNNYTYKEDFLYEFVAKSDDDARGSVEVLKTPECGSGEAIVKATAKKGYKFVTWSNASTQEQTTYSNITSNVTAVAYFVPADVEITFLLGSDAFGNYDKATKTLTIYGFGDGKVNAVSDWGAALPVGEVEHVVVTDGVSFIDASVFQHFSALKDVDTPPALHSVFDYAFSHRSLLESVVVPEGVETLQNGTFTDFDNLTMVTLPASLKNIEAKAFDNCAKNTQLTIILNNATPPDVDEEAFSDIPGETLFIVPCGSLNDYANDLRWHNPYFLYTFSEYFDYVVKVKSNDSKGGTAKVVQEPSCDTPVIIEAEPADGYRFVKWSDGATEPLREFDVAHDYDLTAEFELIKTPISNIKADKVPKNAYKTIIDGRIVIIHDGKMYGVSGEVIR